MESVEAVATGQDKLLNTIMQAIKQMPNVGDLNEHTVRSVLNQRMFAEYNPLRVARTNADMSQKVLADEAGISHVTIGQYESGKSVPRVSAIIDIAQALGMDEGKLASDYAIWLCHDQTANYAAYIEGHVSFKEE